ncbi:MAG: thioredoxin domain-containing protein [Phycisphaerae bacterium]|nr:thioredoxin domain-containing protein [Phycisphaerae bacterium]
MQTVRVVAAVTLAFAVAIAPGEEPRVPQNRLAQESSPYLLQHAGNPVDWYPWGDDAFEAARERGVPIFLSIGYSTCYWCHVMERESFEDDATAALMNELYVSVKVDREERPDIDDLYMTATQLMTGGGGWPMSVFLDPATRRPFYCGTYFPREPMHGRPSFVQVLRGLSDAWSNQREDVDKQADQIAGAVAEHLSARATPVAVGQDQVEGAITSLLRIHDRTEGGFSSSGPKFPQPVYLELLLDALAYAGDDATRDAIAASVRFTLDRMAVGGLFDQVGGGFHRYCVDGSWTVPHFEKMLYDNAQLIGVYARAAHAFDDEFYREVVARTFAYVEREMTAPNGAFYSAQDAEVDGREGLNYLWLPSEVEAVLSAENADLAKRVYGLDASANFRDPHHPEDEPKHVLRMSDRPERVEDRLGIEDLSARLAAINATLLDERSKRKSPGLDDKVLASWNGMMIAALAEASALLDEPNYLDAAKRAADVLLRDMRDEDGRLIRSTRDGRTGGAPVIEDYAHVSRSLLCLHGVDGDERWLTAARELLAIAKEDFTDGQGGYFDTPEGRSDVFVRARSTYDGATPSGVGVLLHALIAMSEIEPEGEWIEDAVRAIKPVTPALAESPVATANSVRAMMRLLAKGDAVEEALADGEPIRSREAQRSEVVQVLSDVESVTVSDDKPATLTLALRIAAGYHVIAAEPTVSGEGGDGLMPMRVGLTRGSGVAVYADYPNGEPYETAALEGVDLLVHTGTLRLPVVIEKADGVGPSPGKPVLGITLQACSETACEAPTTIELGVEIVIED